MNKKIYLVRHGKIDISNEKSYIGITDLPINMEGIIQAKKLKIFFDAIDIEKVYVSYLKRCKQTAQIILENRNIEPILVKQFAEINMGEWEGQTFNYIKSTFPEEFKKRGENIDDFIPPKGESFQQLKERVMPVFRTIERNSKGNILIITHAGVIRGILSNILSIPMMNIFAIREKYGCVNEISWNSKYKKWQWKIVL